MFRRFVPIAVLVLSTGVLLSGAQRDTRRERSSRDRNSGDAAGLIRVSANQPWVDTGLDVQKGDRLTFTATGDITVKPGSTGNPDGVAGMTSKTYPVRGNQAGTLIARVGSRGVPFAIGTINRPIAMPADGRLMLGINDDYFGDNSGQFTVSITPPARTTPFGRYDDQDRRDRQQDGRDRQDRDRQDRDRQER